MKFLACLLQPPPFRIENPPRVPSQTRTEVDFIGPTVSAQHLVMHTCRMMLHLSKFLDLESMSLSSKPGPLFFQVFKGEFQLPDFLKEQSQVQ